MELWTLTSAECSIFDQGVWCFFRRKKRVFQAAVVYPHRCDSSGFLAAELHETDPCIAGHTLDSLKSIGLSGTGLAFVAFPIAICQMPGSFFFAILFFFMMLILGIDSQFAKIEAVATALTDLGIGERLPRCFLSGLICFVFWIFGILFVTNAGVYFLELFDTYISIYVMFTVGALECIGLMWTCGGETWRQFQVLCEENTGLRLGCVSKVGGEISGRTGSGFVDGIGFVEHIYANGSLAARNSFSKNCRVFLMV